MPNGAELFVESISQLGIREIFTLVGDHLNEVLAVAAMVLAALGVLFCEISVAGFRNLSKYWVGTGT